MACPDKAIIVKRSLHILIVEQTDCIGLEVIPMSNDVAVGVLILPWTNLCLHVVADFEPERLGDALVEVMS